ncbi:MAG: hypothetical protein IJZ89_06175 [Clostridia bacterium]|nr:hypothetical protein [Clostridia bacterium]
MNAENNKFILGSGLETEEKSKYEVTIGELIAVIMSKLWILILVGLIAAVGAYFYTAELATPMYRSTARVYILNRQSSMATSINDLNSAVTLKDDFKILIKSNEVYRQVLTTVGEDPANYKTLGGQISLDNNETRFVDITVTDKDPVRAKLLVDAFAKVSRKMAIEIMGVEDITIEELGEIPSAPSSPVMSTNIILAVLAGVVISAAIVVLVHMFNDNVRTTEDIEKALGVCVLGSIPDISMLRRPKNKSKKSAKKKASRK